MKEVEIKIRLNGQQFKIDLNQAIYLHEQLTEFIQSNSSEITKRFIRSIEELNTSITAIKGRSRSKNILFKRMAIAYYLIDWGLRDNVIANFFNRDRTTMIYHRTKINTYNRYPNMYPEFHENVKKLEKIWKV